MTLARARSGDRAAMEALYRAFERPVYTLARRITGSTEDAAEILQETFLEVLRSLSRLRNDAALGAWMRKVTTSKALMRVRGLRKHPDRRRSGESLGPDLEAIELRPLAKLEPPESRIDLERALAELSSTARTVVWLHDVEGMTHAEIGELMGRSTSFSKSQLARAHARLRQSLGNLEHSSEARTYKRAVGTG